MREPWLLEDPCLPPPSSVLEPRDRVAETPPSTQYVVVFLAKRLNTRQGFSPRSTDGFWMLGQNISLGPSRRNQRPPGPCEEAGEKELAAVGVQELRFIVFFGIS